MSSRKTRGWQYRPEWLFDDSPIPDPRGKGKRAVEFISRLRHPKSMEPDQAFHFPRWMRRLIAKVYGDTRPDGRRKITEVFLMLPRGNRKSTLAGAIGLLHTIGPEKSPKGQCVIAARDRDQAYDYTFSEARDMVEMDAYLSSLATVRKAGRLTHGEKKSSLFTVSADAMNKHGGTVALALEDEIHAWKNDVLHGVLTTSLNKFRVPDNRKLRWMMTTAGRGTGTLAWEQYQKAKDILRGKVKSETFLPVIFEAPYDVDYRDENIWHLVNPGLIDGYQDIDGIRELAIDAKRSPSAKAQLLNDHLNVWAQTASNPFIEPAVYDACGKKKVDLKELKDLPCWLAVDLSSTVDLSVIVACWRRPDGTYILWAWFFCPEDNLEEREERSEAPYKAWVKKGLVTATPGNVIDYRAIEDKIRKLCGPADPDDPETGLDVQEVAFDPHLARQVQPNLMEEGIPCVDVRQVPSMMMPAIKETERAILGRELSHGSHPILRYCFLNAEVERNRQGHPFRWVKPSRWKSIDGAVAASMAVLRASAGDSGKAYYEKEGAVIESVSWQ